MTGLSMREDAPVQELRAATRLATVSLVDLALAEQVSFVVLAGDIFDGDWRDMSTGLFFNAQMLRLDSAGIAVYLIKGNHDADSVVTRSLTLPPNVYSFSTSKAETHLLDAYPVAIHGRGFPKRQIPENIVSAYPEAVSGRYNIGLLHTSLAGNSRHDTYAPCTLDELQRFGYDYWALGHIHQPKFYLRTPTLYSVAIHRAGMCVRPGRVAVLLFRWTRQEKPELNFDHLTVSGGIRSRSTSVALPMLKRFLIESSVT